MKAIHVVLCGLLLLGYMGTNASVHELCSKEPFVDQVKRSIDRGVRFLRKTQRENGSWELYTAPFLVHQKGGTVHTDLTDGDDPAIGLVSDYTPSTRSAASRLASQRKCPSEAGRRRGAWCLTWSCQDQRITTAPRT